MKEHFKEQLDAGPADGTSELFIVFYLLEGVVHRLPNVEVDNLDEDYECIGHVGAVPILSEK